MTRHGTSHEQVAVYWDFENIHASLRELSGSTYTPWAIQDEEVDVRSVMAYVANLGTVVLNRAYANWEKFRCYREVFNEYGVDLVQLYPRGANSKNGADIRLALDALEDIFHFPHISHVVILSGDSDFLGVAQKLRLSGRAVIGVGVQGFTNRFWKSNCTEFKDYQSLVQRAQPQSVGEVVHVADGDRLTGARETLVTAVRQMAAQRGEDQVVKAALRPMMVRLDPGFDEHDLGFSSFNAFVDACADLLVVTRGEHDHMVKLRDVSTADASPAHLEGSGAAADSGVMAAAQPAVPAAPQSEEDLATLIAEVARAEEHFSSGGFVGLNYFVRSWSSQTLPRGQSRRALLDAAVERGLIEVYTTEGAVEALRVRGRVVIPRDASESSPQDPEMPVGELPGLAPGDDSGRVRAETPMDEGSTRLTPAH